MAATDHSSTAWQNVLHETLGRAKTMYTIDCERSVSWRARDRRERERREGEGARAYGSESESESDGARACTWMCMRETQRDNHKEIYSQPGRQTGSQPARQAGRQKNERLKQKCEGEGELKKPDTTGVMRQRILCLALPASPPISYRLRHKELLSCLGGDTGVQQWKIPAKPS